MNDISEFEARITAALERIGRAVAVAEERAEATTGESLLKRWRRNLGG